MINEYYSLQNPCGFVILWRRHRNLAPSNSSGCYGNESWSVVHWWMFLNCLQIPNCEVALDSFCCVISPSMYLLKWINFPIVCTTQGLETVCMYLHPKVDYWATFLLFATKIMWRPFLVLGNIGVYCIVKYTLLDPRNLR